MDTPRSATPASHLAASDILRVMTYNIRFDYEPDGVNRWPNRRRAVTDLIRHEDADVVGLQEVLPHQLDDIRADLSDIYDIVAVARADSRPGGGDRMTILFRRTRFEAVEHGGFWLSQTPEIPGSVGWDASAPRNAAWTRLRHRASGSSSGHLPDVFVCCTHLDHLGGEARVNGAKLIRQRMTALTRDLPLLVMGDFNTEPHEAPHAAMTDTATSAPLSDAAASNGAPSRPTYYGFDGLGDALRSEPAVLDYIFHNHRLAITGYTVVETRNGIYYPSDHLPVVATFRFG